MKKIEESLAVNLWPGAALLFMGTAEEVERQKREWIKEHGKLCGPVVLLTIDQDSK
jgi:hypothetical protein